MLTDNPTAPLLLIVEDDANHAELIQRSFEEAPEEYRLEILGTVSAAGAAAQKRSPGLVLTDYRLPDGDGSELVLDAAGLYPVIIMTSHGSQQVAVEAMKIGAHDYIVKSPETFEKLADTVKLALMTWAVKTARREISAAVFQAKKDWELTFDAVPDLISIIDLSHTITRVNRAMAARCGLPPQELIGRKCYEVIDGKCAPHANCSHAKMIQTGKAYSTRIEDKRFDGYFNVTAAPLFDEEGVLTGCVHVMHDVTEIKRAEEERQNLEKQLQHAQKMESLGVLSGGIAHDFNNILTIILGHCYILKDDIDSGIDPKVHVQQIEAAGNRAADLCRQMLTYAGKSPLLQTEFSFWLLVDEVVKMLNSAIKKNVAITLDLKRDIPMIVGDSSQIQQVIMNLLINAGEAIGDNQGTIAVSLKKTFIDDSTHPETDYFGSRILPGSYACLEVSDSGCGMSEETKQRIFEPFYTTKFTGRGLGMSAILGIVKAHNGALQLASTPDVGTTFKVYIPLAAVQEQFEAAAPEDAVKSALSAKTTILLVEDENTLLNMEAALLEALGFVVITATNGREALETYRLRGSGIDLVMLDLVMPEMDGIEAYHELRKIDMAVPIIICSGYGAESVENVIAKDERAGFLHKPYNMWELRRLLNEKTG
ncbi:MAG: response regulator [Desulfuromonadaceae bacterium]|nr:response regulator [Desulfuromonadaceae bacterium]